MEERHTKKTLFFIISLSCLAIFTWGFVTVVEEWKENEIAGFDDGVFTIIHAFVSPKLTALMTSITFLGGVKWLSICTVSVVIILLFMKKYPLALFVAISVGLGAGFNLLLKWIFKRERPDIEALIQQGGYSFPSGHSMGSFIFYGALAFMLFRAFDRMLFKWSSVFLLAILIVFIGISRIYLGVHYASDIVGGFTAGGGWLTLCIAVYLYFYKRSDWKYRDE
ncbi:phosphatase PAP2 family protein [Rossellomorea aquimaris]|uniref:phosphatase PAP2 family protein n=1 Tax=Rossellomorea aquimaris TaxID=189382 RepID=UPI001CD778B2|nr:phosphatase PAP2 family protein [Rossellomorea aquimaris]MCA1054478.1 phosphatase PAP2 family protein [Rossellomorea aquimaris]